MKIKQSLLSLLLEDSHDEILKNLSNEKGISSDLADLLNDIADSESLNQLESKQDSGSGETGNRDDAIEEAMFCIVFPEKCSMDEEAKVLKKLNQDEGWFDNLLEYNDLIKDELQRIFDQMFENYQKEITNLSTDPSLGDGTPATARFV